MKKMLDPSCSTRPSIQETLEQLGSVGLKELKDKQKMEGNAKGSFELGTYTLDERKLKRGGEVSSYQFKGFSNKFIPSENQIKDPNSKTIGNTFAFSDTMRDSRLQKITKTDTTKIDVEDFPHDQLDENIREGKMQQEEMDHRNMVCKTLTNIKTKSTFIEGASHAKHVPNNSSLIFANESTLRVHKGSSDIFHGSMPSSKTSMDK